MEECGFPSPPLALYKGAGWGLDRPAQPIKTQEGQATGVDLLPRPTTARSPDSTVRNPGCMEAAWLTRRTEATDEATSPHPVIVRNGRLGNRASAPSSEQATPPRLPPLMELARTVPLYRDVTHACRVRPRARHPRHARLSPRCRVRRVPFGEDVVGAEADAA